MFKKIIFLCFAATVCSQDHFADFQKKLKDVTKKVTPAFVFFENGSGVLISEDGWILTNHHVAGPAGKEHKIHITGGKEFNAKVIGYDPLGDISLVKIDEEVKGLPFLELGDSDALKNGDFVIAVGNPFLLGSESWEPTVTFGTITALHRYQDWYMDAVQTDAQINPGNSGGPLITLEGKIIGINGRIAMRFGNRVNTGVGYAIPSNQIRRYLPYLKKGGRVLHGFIDGITVTEIDNPTWDMGEYGDGVLVVSTEDPSPAFDAGIRVGDIIIEVDGKRTFNLNRFHGVLGTYPAGETVRIKVKRTDNGKTITKTLKVFLGQNDK